MPMRPYLQAGQGIALAVRVAAGIGGVCAEMLRDVC